MKRWKKTMPPDPDEVIEYRAGSIREIKGERHVLIIDESESSDCWIAAHVDALRPLTP